MIEKHTVSRDNRIYEAFPDVALTTTGRLVCLFLECTHHGNRDYTRIMQTHSDDRGRTWSAKKPFTEALRGDPKTDPFWDCPRISTLSDGSLAAVVNRVGGRDGGHRGGEQSNHLLFSRDEGDTWDRPCECPVYGIVPDQVVELKNGPKKGRWLLSAHTVTGEGDEYLWQERCWYSDDGGGTWDGPAVIAARPDLQLCEGSIVELPGGELVCFMRENSGRGLDAFKCLSRDGGETWDGPVEFPLPGCHRPVAGMLQSGRVMITHRFMQGGKGWVGWWTQNLFAALTDIESCLASKRGDAHTRIMPLDFDRSLESDTGYSGWVQFPDGGIYVVNYVMDDAPKAFIRGYSLREDDFIVERP